MKFIHFNRKRKQTGQCTLEYVIGVAAVISVLLVFLNPGGTFQTSLQGTLDDASAATETMANRLAASYSTRSTSEWPPP